MHKNRLLSLALVALLASALLSGCVIATPTVAPEPETATTTGEITLSATEYAFDGQDTAPAGWVNITVTNDGEAPHGLLLLRLDEGKTIDDVFAALQTEEVPTWIKFFGGVNDLEPGDSASYTIQLAAGTYIGISLAAGEDQVPDAAKGMVKEITITEATGTAEPTMEADVTVQLLDFAFAISGPLSAGEHTVQVVNAGGEAHEMVIFKLNEGVTMEDFQAFMQTEDPNAEPPFTDGGSLLPIEAGLTAYLTLDLEPGNYVGICFLPSLANEGMPHFMLGMITEFTVE